MKRTFDVVCSTAGLILFSPLLTAISVLILALDGRPILFRQERVGFRGRTFQILKFRTMRQALVLDQKLLTVGDDPRITGIGRLLRRFKLDELPQLWNVLRGDMSLVGPRPEVPHFVSRYSREQRHVLELKPGITDPASITYSNESDVLQSYDDPERAYIEILMPDKIRMNLDYARRANVVSDSLVIGRTLLRIKSASRRAA